MLNIFYYYFLHDIAVVTPPHSFSTTRVSHLVRFTGRHTHERICSQREREQTQIKERSVPLVKSLSIIKGVGNAPEGTHRLHRRFSVFFLSSFFLSVADDETVMLLSPACFFAMGPSVDLSEEASAFEQLVKQGCTWLMLSCIIRNCIIL